MKALNFTNLCSDLIDVDQIKKSLEFYNEEFSIEKVIEYFDNWSIDDTRIKDNVRILIHEKDTNITKITLLEDEYCSVYVFNNLEDFWQPIPKTISDFISDCIRQEVDLTLSEKGYNKVY